MDPGKDHFLPEVRLPKHSGRYTYILCDNGWEATSQHPTCITEKKIDENGSIPLKTNAISTAVEGDSLDLLNRQGN